MTQLRGPLSKQERYEIEQVGFFINDPGQQTMRWMIVALDDALRATLAANEDLQYALNNRDNQLMQERDEARVEVAIKTAALELMVGVEWNQGGIEWVKHRISEIGWAQLQALVKPPSSWLDVQQERDRERNRQMKEVLAESIRRVTSGQDVLPFLRQTLVELEEGMMP